MSSADNLCKQFGPWQGRVECVLELNRTVWQTHGIPERFLEHAHFEKKKKKKKKRKKKTKKKIDCKSGDTIGRLAQFSLCRCSYGSSRCRTAGLPWCTGTRFIKNKLRSRLSTTLTCRPYWPRPTPDRWQSKTIILSMNVDQKSSETEISIAICRPTIKNTVSSDFFICVRRLLSAFSLAAYPVWPKSRDLELGVWSGTTQFVIKG